LAGEKFPERADYFLRPGYIYVPGEPTLISTVLGSCVAVCLWDRERRYGGMNHFLYPFVRDPYRATAKFGNVATRALIRLLLQGGSRKEQLESQIFGGSHPENNGGEGVKVSNENIEIARRILTTSGIPIVSQDVGGTRGRKLVFNSSTNEVVVVRVDRLRDSDWYPYEGSR
jgi:chemotaxis protein CheD